MFFTYIARCADDTLYVGHTEDLASRENIHNDGKGAKYHLARPLESSDLISATTMPTVMSGTCATTSAFGFMTLVGP